MDFKERKTSGLCIDEVFPALGGIGINWSGDIGFGEFMLTFGSDGKLHAMTEHVDSNEDKRFTAELLRLLVDEIVIDE